MFPYVYMCAQGSREQKPQSPRVTSSPLFYWGDGVLRVEHNSCRRAHQEFVKRQTAKEENSIWNLPNLPQTHWNTRLPSRWGMRNLRLRMAASHGQSLSHSHTPCGCKPTELWEGGLLTEIKAPVSTHELKSIHQLSPAECLRSSRGGAGEGEQAQGQVEEMRGGHDVHLDLRRKQKEGHISSSVLARGVRVGHGCLDSQHPITAMSQGHPVQKCNSMPERPQGGLDRAHLGTKRLLFNPLAAVEPWRSPPRTPSLWAPTFWIIKV